MDEEEEPQGKKKAGSDSTVLLLGLYLLLLAFFIVLNTISTTDNLKSDVVQSSLTSTFSTLLEPRVREAFTSQVGAVVEAQEFHTEVTDLFASAIPAVKVRIIEPGQLLTVSFHSDSLFLPDTTDFRPARLDLLDRLIATLSAEPADYAYEMEFLIGVAPEDDGTLPVLSGEGAGLGLEQRRRVIGRPAKNEGPDIIHQQVHPVLRRRHRPVGKSLPPAKGSFGILDTDKHCRPVAHDSERRGDRRLNRGAERHGLQPRDGRHKLPQFSHPPTWTQKFRPI